MLQRLIIWWTILRIALVERLVYRGDFALGTLMRFLPIVTQIFLWHAIFGAVSAATAPGASGSAVTLAGYRYQDMVAYYLLSMVGRAFSSMPGLASGIAGQIRSGEVKKFLIQPVDMLGFLLLGRVAHKLVYYTVAIAPFGLVFFLCRSYFQAIPPDAFTWFAFFVSLVLSFLIAYFLEATLGLVAFWFLEVSSLVFVYMLLSFFLSGHMFPLDILPEPWLSLVHWLPFKYLAYFPAAVFLGKVPRHELAVHLWIQAGWFVFFVVLARITFYLGARRYSAYGG